MNKNYTAPAFLEKGDKIGICSMASAVGEQAIKNAIELLENAGFDVICADQIFAQDFTFAGDDEIRRSALQAMLDDNEIKAIFSSRGGYGVSRIIDKLNFDGFIQNPKWIVGFSDITALHCKIQSLGFQSIHGPMPSTFEYDEASTAFLLKILMGHKDDIHATPHEANVLGEVSAPIVGGNLCLLAHNIGSASDISFDGHLLFIEDIGEYVYNIDRMLLQLKRAGKLKKLAGLIVGDFSDSKENDRPFGKTIQEIILDHTSGGSYPIGFNFPIGHETVNFAVRNGAQITLSISNIGSKLSYNELV